MRRRRDLSGVAVISSAHPVSDPRIHLREAASLAGAGLSVTLIGVRADDPPAGTGVRLISLPRRRRLSRMTLGSMHAVFLALRTRASIVHLHDPELIWAVPLLRAAGRRVVYDAHEDLPQQVHNKTYLPRQLRPLASRLCRGLLSVAARSDHVVAATETIAGRFPVGRVSIVRNYPVLRSNEAPSALADRPARVAHLGLLSVERGAEQMVDALGDPLFPDGWEGVLAGAPSPEGLLETLRTRPGWERWEYLGLLPPGAARDVLAHSRVGLVVLQRSQAYLDSLPTKMFEYFAAGVPVIASDFPLWRQIVERFDCGLLVDETDPSAIARAVATYAEDPELLARHGAHARAAANSHLNWQAEAEVLVAAYRGLVTW